MTAENPITTEATSPAAEPAAAPGLAGPVRTPERVGSVDLLRGVALLGILVMNIYAFAMPWPAYTNPLLYGGTGAFDMGTWWASHLLAEMKFMTIFSMLFGAGLALMAERAEARGGRFMGIYYRRLLWLGLIGLVHAYLMWFGDILFWYALIGTILYPLRRLKPVVLIPAGLVLLMGMVPISLGFGFFALPMMKAQAHEALDAREAGEELSRQQQDAIETWKQFQPTEEQLAEEIAVYRNGYLGQVIDRAPKVLMFHIFFLLFFGFWRIGGLMVLGIGLMKLGVFSARRSTGFYVGCCLLGYGVGLPVTWLGARAMVASEFDPLFLNQGGFFPNYFASILVAMGHVGLVMLVWKAGVLSGLVRRLSAVGRMALTNYLSHTVLCTTLFYGWGIGLYGHLSRFQLMGVVLAVWIFQLVVSPWWLGRYRFGPAEWLWRSLTYGKRQPMRVTPAAQS